MAMILGQTDDVAPARERGLKFQDEKNKERCYGRSRKGAWIEIALCVAIGAAATVAPARERGLKSFRCYWTIWNEWVAPARERGLKYSRSR